MRPTTPQTQLRALDRTAVQKSPALGSLATYGSMTARSALPSILILLLGASACAKTISDGDPCFQSSECNGGSICAATVYGKFCMKTCSPDVVRCDNLEACLRTSEVGFGGAGGAGGEAGQGGVGGLGGSGGEAGQAGSGGSGGAGGEVDEEVWVCLPGDLQSPDFIPRVIGQVCDYSVDCVRGGVCVCIPGATCAGQGKNGPTCEELCDPSVINQCPRGLACTDLGTGRGFCDPSTFEGN
jgi:hypothetical protein